MDAIEVSQITHLYGSRRSLDAVSFTVGEGSIHGFVGPNGAGKSTTLRILATLLSPLRGRALVFGHDVVAEPLAVRRLIGYMSDSCGMYRRMICDEYLQFFATAYGLEGESRQRAVDDVLALTDMTPRRKDLVHGLSRGMRQRLALARLLLHDPRLLLLDEPASGLDPRARIELAAILRELKGMGKTIFIASHILSELGELCDAVTILDRGRVAFSGSLASMLGGGEAGRWRLRLGAPVVGLAGRLQGLAGVSEVESIDDGLCLRLRLEGFDPTPVLAAVLAAGGVVLSWGEERRELGQAFMALTTGGLA